MQKRHKDTLIAFAHRTLHDFVAVNVSITRERQSTMTDQDFVQRLESEVQVWLKEKLITADQAKSLTLRYEGVASVERRPFAGVLAFLGALLLGMGVIVFFASNWQNIPGWVKLLSIFTSVVLAYGVGYRFRYEGTTFQGTGNALLFLGALLYGAGLFLIAQGYHVNAHEPFLLLLWVVGVLPIAYLLRFRAMVTLSLLLLFIALSWESFYWNAESSSFHGFLAVVLVFGCLLYALGNLQSLREALRLFKQPFGVMGLWLVMGTLFVETFGDAHSGMATVLNYPSGAILRFWELAGMGLVVSLSCLVTRFSALHTRAEDSTLLLLILMGCGLFYYQGGVGAWAVFANLLLLAVIIGVVAVGYIHRETAWINTGFFYFGLLVVARYCDWFWALLDRSLFFIGAGILLIGGGMYLERTRRKTLNRLQPQEEATL